LIENSSASRQVQHYLEELSKKYLYDVNSPFYNEDYFILFLQSFLKSNTIPEDSKIRYNILLQIASKNKVGELANDFTYFADNKMDNLYNIEGKFTVLFFYEVGCLYCEESIRALGSNSDFSNLINSDVRMLALYPDGEKDMWEKYRNHIPENWINGIDLKKTIIKQGLYDLKASPTIYLLDENKRVILKDASIEELLRFLQNRRQGE
jgi:thioredoxin-related protein